MAYTKYSLTPANNTATPPDGAPEGMLPSAVNDTMRDMMAQIRDVGDGIRDGTYTMTAAKITGGTITGATINNSAIGGTTAAAGAFTTLSATSDASISGLTVGKGAGSITTNTAVGASALAVNTTGNNNTAIGSGALDVNTTGIRNTGVGSNALGANTDGEQNTSVGNAALQANTSGDNNVAVGRAALAANTTANNNTAVGADALGSNTTASNNTAVGYQALYSNTTGIRNTALGYQALDANTTGTDNVAVGHGALTSSTSEENCAIGYAALESLTTGVRNTALGYASGNALTTGSKNTIIGRYSGNQSGLDIRTASNYTIISDGDGRITFVGNGSATNNRYVQNDGTNFIPGTDNVMNLGAASYRWAVVYAGNGTINTSDGNEKQDIESLSNAELSTAKAIKSLIKKFKFKDAVAIKGDNARIHVGVIAQDVQKAFSDNGLDATKYGIFCSDTWTDKKTGEQKTRLGVRYDQLLAFVIASL